jgi:hypothetical protein
MGGLVWSASDDLLCYSPVVTLTDESTWNELGSKKENADEETETCVGVRGVLSHMCS